MPLATRPQVQGFLGYAPDPTAAVQYGNNATAGANPVTPENKQTAYNAVLDTIGGRRRLRSSMVAVEIPALGAAVTQDTALPTELLDRPGTVLNATFYPYASLTGQVTNNRTWSLVNKGPAGAGNTSMGAGFTSGAGNNLVDGVATPLTVTVGTVAAGDRLVVRSAANGTGQADPGGIVVFEIDRT